MGRSDLDGRTFAMLGRPRRLWVVGAAHAEAARLARAHAWMTPGFRAGDRVVYLGNLIGRGPGLHRSLDEVLAFRRFVLSTPGAIPSDVIFLRGAQEEMWQKLLQVQFAPDPKQALAWMLDQGVEATLAAYGSRPQDAMGAARDGVIQLTRWTSRLREAMRNAPGHVNYFAELRRAALTDPPEGGRAILMVSAGLDVTRPLVAQRDNFWWSPGGFADIAEPYEQFGLILRGFDPQGRGVRLGAFTCSLDAGSGRGGRLACARIGRLGEIEEIREF